MQEYKQLENYDCIVVGGGASGLAAISAMADLGITNTLLLEKNAEAGGSLLTDSEPLSLSGKSFSGKALLAQFLRLIDIYEVKTAFHRELLSVSLNEMSRTSCTIPVMNKMSQDSPAPLIQNKTADGEKGFLPVFTLTVKNTISQKDELYYSNYLILAFSNSKTFSLHDAGIPEDRVKMIEGKSLSDALTQGGKVGREMGELLLRKK
ncbi:hypothetical protein HMPREF9624_02115 [Oribacterium asaccharolyticum ACB7]|uniref:FAD-dependent oxidoreductase 2 FAD binding domain-containing protein n=1 Tax=Oribacterium asaccharolyticum ACB7 TaxID=796944 RepID=G9WSP9_9FIRM|nr:NAD(P)-binding protein [Oribacterium asaccharolyticum]EHL13636.1 hypothetical protein HMPREF9624_02115 [Oribacterium asaccharolyticum ACB7]